LPQNIKLIELEKMS